MFANSALMPRLPLIEDYAARVVSRPAFARAQSLD
jgi:hypothetical protein